MRITRNFDTECIHEINLYESSLGLLDSQSFIEKDMKDALKIIIKRFEKRFYGLKNVLLQSNESYPELKYFHPIYGHPLQEPFNYHSDTGKLVEWHVGTPFDLNEYDRGRGIIRNKGKSIFIKKMDPRIGILRTIMNGRRRLLHTNTGKPVKLVPSAVVYLKDQILNGTHVLLDKSVMLNSIIIGSELWIDGISMADDLVAGGIAEFDN